MMKAIKASLNNIKNEPPCTFNPLPIFLGNILTREREKKLMINTVEKSI